jgi:hypothetical protein
VQTPAAQARFVPQLVPFGSCTAELSRHTSVPVEHEVMPVRHGSGFVAHTLPSAQAAQTPALQTWSVPQLVPFGEGAAALSAHCSVPVEHEVTPERQGSGFVAHTTPAVQELQTPPLQTRLAPQVVPFVSGAAALFTHCSVPVEHEVTPPRQGSGFVPHAIPAVQAPQTPPLQTWPGPQVAPFGKVVAVSMQVWDPVAHEVVPATQTFGLVEQVRPAVQELHAPPLQT